jgi:hypothetical protein
MTGYTIGILTFHRCINYGSYWQARCLAEGLRARGHTVEILDHESWRVNLAEWKCAYRPVLPTAVQETDYPFYRKKIKSFFRAFDTLPLSPRFPLHNPDAIGHYDIVVVGSDEVWNLFHPWYGKCGLFYGEGIRTKQLISYAASFGNYDASLGLETTWVEKLQNFSSISVRDENSRTIIRHTIGIEPDLVLDPCLQFPIEAEKRELDHLNRPYIAVYGHNFSHPFAQGVKKYAREKKLPLISIGYRNDWADEQWLTADPHDFAHFMVQSEAVATNFFHGCVFALSNAKSFACEKSFYRSNKIQGLMNKLDGEKHLISEDASSNIYHERLGAALDPHILQKIDHFREMSTLFLDRALTLKQFNSHEQAA